MRTTRINTLSLDSDVLQGHGGLAVVEKEAHAQAEAQKEKDEAEVQVNCPLCRGCDIKLTARRPGRLPA
ncbi:hypothetical protein F2P81_011592 [Scophthalmus maximus]|uniref:Uncharacterized protein n=1 Tax=Scophthalmus maximus TaxID=52904 RepID=A0A6A4SWN3_SCOMX|nr:hypothetical protein F2P81_011592 [Scophthalmus maximus]